MKFLFLLENYNWFYSNAFEKDQSDNSLSYAEHLIKLLSHTYYQSDGLGNALSGVGHQAEYIIPHCYPLQLNWLKEHDKKTFLKYQVTRPLRSFESRVLGRTNPLQRIAEEICCKQVELEKPDILYLFSGVWLGKEALERMKKCCGKMILQWSCPIANDWKKFPFSLFDLILSSAPSLIRSFSSKGIRTAFLQQAFDERLSPSEQVVRSRAVFAGNFHPAHHKKRIKLIDLLLAEDAIDVLCPNPGNDPVFKQISSSRMEAVEGIRLSEAFASYKIALHYPGDDFMEDAGAKRLFEITGSGAMLLAFAQPGIEKYFVAGKEIVLFTGEADCLEKIRYYLSHEEERASIAAAGKKRTSTEHTFRNRATELLKLLQTEVQYPKICVE